jgi:hypothetical protein
MFKEYGPRPFADNQEFPKIFIASLMRSGSTFFRSLFQQVTGTCTGAAGRLLDPPGYQLNITGMRGCKNTKGWGVKSHYPFCF